MANYSEHSSFFNDSVLSAFTPTEKSELEIKYQNLFQEHSELRSNFREIQHQN